jgi:RNA polymerase sigma factor (sigma-70 family)
MSAPRGDSTCSEPGCRGILTVSLSSRQSPTVTDPPPPAREQNSRELLSRFARGDDSALGELVERESPRILARLRRRFPRQLNGRFGASDILQLTAVDLVRIRGDFENQGVGAFREMVATIADRTMAGAIERERALKRDPGREVHAAPTGNQSEAAGGLERFGAVDSRTPSRDREHTEAVRQVDECLRHLPEGDREVLLLVDYEELSLAEAAEQLGLSISATQKRHTRAFARLRDTVRRRAGS